MFLAAPLSRAARLFGGRARVFAPALFGAAACVSSHISPLSPADAPNVARHAVFVNNNGDGLPLDCAATSGFSCPASYDAQLALIAKTIRDSGQKRILIRIHGGLNTLGSALQTTTEMLVRIQDDSANESAQVYPIFINWESGIKSTYAEHLFFITQGQTYRTFGRAVVAMPVYFLADVGKAAVRAPFTLGQQFRNFVHGTRHTSPTPDTANDDGIERSVGGYHWRTGEKTWYYTKAIVLTPLKMLGVVVVDAFGTPGWDNMHRRTNTMFRDPNEFKAATENKQRACSASAAVACDPESFAEPTGAVSKLLDAIQALAQEDSSLRVTLIGHSMGTIVATEIVRTRDSIPFDNIVFMAAANSVREFELGVVPYLERHQKTQFYNLTLHPTAELKEQTILGFGPNGSLLEWIDAYLANPATDPDRMMGKYVNIREAEHMFVPGIRHQIHIKAFGYRDSLNCGGNEPYHHGGFNSVSVPFWRREFWEPGTKPCPKYDSKTRNWSPR